MIQPMQGDATLDGGLVDIALRHAPHTGFTDTDVLGLRFYRQDTPSLEPMPVVYEPSVCVIVQGEKRLRFGERILTYDPGHYLVNALTVPIEAEIPEASAERPFLGFLLRFESVQLGKLLAEIDERPEPDEAIWQTMDTCRLDDDLVRAFTRLLRCLDDSTDLRILAGSLVREILYEVLRGPGGHLLRAQAARGGRARQVGQAVAFVEANYREPLTVDAIAREAAMSPSALHQHFKQLTALSPMQYVQRYRLHQARALLHNGHAAAEAGHEVGYRSPSQFSREFRRLFRVPPSQVRAS
ncbi:MAG: AraC family transcriptional regulator [Acidobacteriota bacterium]